MLRGQRRAAVLKRHTASAPALSALKLATTNARLATAGFTGTKGRYQTSGTRTGFVGQTQHIAAGNYSELRVCVPGAWFVDDTGEFDLGNSFVIDKMAVYIYNTTYQVPVTFSGSRSLTVGGLDYYLSDPITSFGPFDLTQPGNTTDVRRFSIQAKGHVASSGHYLPQATPAYLRGDTDTSNARIWTYDPATNPSVEIDGGTWIPAPAGAVPISFAPSWFLVGLPKAPVRSVYCLGDSLTFGYNENVDANVPYPYPDEYGIMGPYSRAAVNSAVDGGGAAGVAYANLIAGVHSEAAGGFNGSHARRMAFAKFCNIAHVAYGTNDLGTAAVTEARLAALYATVKADPNIQKLLASTIPPRTTSTDGWATLANQTPVAGWTSGGEADLLNAWIATGGGGALDGYADLRAAVADTGTPSKWAVNGSANYATQDGIHWQAATAMAAGNALRTLWGAQVVA